VAETAIIVAIPEAEGAVQHLRAQHTRDGAQGAPPHVTLLYPFTDSSRLVEGRLDEVAAILGAFAAFDFSLASIARFSTTPCALYLRPSPDAPFREMTRALVAAFPEHPPYGDEHHDVTPHATVAVADEETLAGIERQLLESLPIVARAREAALMTHEEGRGAWRLGRRFPLG
jgi:2'-5' RNA ligase